MGKSVYSIVLDDDVVKGIDMMANRNGTSRSNMINRILAQHISLPTAETMVNDIYTSIDRLLQGHNSLAVQLLGNGSMINMRSALQYKYNPSVKYTIEIYEKGDYIGQLKITMRSQNSRLISILDSFFYLWSQLEMDYTDLANKEFSYGNGKYNRLLRLVDYANYNEYGKNIALYIDLLDKCLKEYFNYYSVSQASAIRTVKQLYLTNLSEDLSKL